MDMVGVKIASRQRLDLAQEVESQSIAATLDVAQWTLQGRRNRIFVLVSGTGDIVCDGESAALQAPALIWIPSGKPARLTLFAGSRGAWLAISDVALGQLDLPGNIAQDIRLMSLYPQLGRRIAHDVAARLTTHMSILESELRDNFSGAQEMVRHQLAIVAILLWRTSGPADATARPAPRMLINSFLHLVEQHMRHHWSVADYARSLDVSPDHLNGAARRATGQTPLALIHTRLLAEAQQLLENSGLQIAEIASALGFEDAAYFSRFFKRLSGRSPRQYRTELVRSPLRHAGTFAAWP